MRSEPGKLYKRAWTISLVLLFFLGITALGGAIPMMIDPSGQMMRFPPDMLELTPFDNFLIPGIILGAGNGVLSLLLGFLVLKRHRLQAWLVIFQGSFLTIWLTAEILMGLFYSPLTIPYLLIAAALITTGIMIKLSKSGLS